MERPLARYFYARARVSDLTKRPIFGAVGVVLRTRTVVCEIIPIFSNIWKVNGVSVKGKFAIFFTGCTSSSSNGNRSKIQEQRKKKIKEEDQKSLSCRELGLVKPC